MKQLFKDVEKMDLAEVENELFLMEMITRQYFKLINLGKLKRYVNLLHIRKYKLENGVA